MARLIKCPRCGSQIDATGIEGGTTVQCPDCEAILRVPAAPAPAPAAAPPAQPAASSPATKIRAGRQTPLFRKATGARMPGGAPGGKGTAVRRGGGQTRMRRPAPAPKKSSAPLILGIGGGVLVLILILVFALGGSNNQPSNTNNNNNTSSNQNRTQGEPNPTAIDDSPEPTPAAPTEKKPEKAPEVGIKKDAKGDYIIPDNFSPGAKEETTAMSAVKTKDMGVDEALISEVREKLKSGKVGELLDAYSKYTGAVICNMPDDDEDVARNAFTFMNRLSAEKLELKSGDSVYQFDMKKFNSAHLRASEWAYWSTFWAEAKPGKQTLKDMVEGVASMENRVSDPSTLNLDELMTKLRNCGDYDEEGTPDHLAFQQIKQCGKAAWPLLAEYITHEDVSIGKAANHVLNKLTGQDKEWTRQYNRDESLRQARKGEWVKYHENN